MPSNGKRVIFPSLPFFPTQLYTSPLSFVLTLGFVVRDLDWEINPIEGVFFCNLSYYVS